MSRSETPEQSRFRRRRILLAIGVASPIFALLSVLVAALAFPHFNHARQYISVLGSALAPHPIIFNAGVLIAGIGAGLAGVGFGFGLVGVGGGRVPAVITALCFALAAVGLVVSSLYHWPDPRHLFVNLGLGIQIAPLALVWGLWRVEEMRGLKRFLIAVFVLMAVLTVLTRHLMFPGLVNDDNVGWWERAFAVVLVGWSAVAALVLERRLLQLARRNA